MLLEDDPHATSLETFYKIMVDAVKGKKLTRPMVVDVKNKSGATVRLNIGLWYRLDEWGNFGFAAWLGDNFEASGLLEERSLFSLFYEDSLDTRDQELKERKAEGKISVIHLENLEISKSVNPRKASALG